ncbi:fimbria/pilus periplasmic chaperone [Klebsiella quasipneumoniae]|uniref:fimbria/pilus periplasmic chaperone n=1 Tax=Klebsiella quasipneumoniae TaxID=1463165 RepID=UPI001C83DDB8|nr:fimbria/pilus periplasmic chaperone [Klebsiella quasipneumoniae]MBX4839353.1 fimbria/pilus periplasmic chaperone [Klebsiella quasipneumoniae]
MKGFILLLLTFFIIPAQAGIVIYGTRVIYPAAKNEVMVQLMNRGDRGALVQAWIDDGNTSIAPENIRVPFLISPPVVRVRANTGQQLKIKALSNTLPRNQESLFYLNVLDIPPNASVNDGKNVVKFAIQNRIKLFYRPEGVTGVTQASFHHLVLQQKGKNLFLQNNSANWITIPEIKTNNVKGNSKAIMLAPFSQQMITLGGSVARQYKITLIDDYGNYISDSISVK